MMVPSKPARLQPADVRAHRHEGNGWKPATLSKRLTWVGCDICGKSRQEMRKAHLLSKGHGDLVICCRRCVSALTEGPPKAPRAGRFWPFRRRPAAPEMGPEQGLNVASTAPRGTAWPAF